MKLLCKKLKKLRKNMFLSTSFDFSIMNYVRCFSITHAIDRPISIHASLYHTRHPYPTLMVLIIVHFGNRIYHMHLRNIYWGLNCKKSLHCTLECTQINPNSLDPLGFQYVFDTFRVLVMRFPFWHVLLEKNLCKPVLWLLNFISLEFWFGSIWQRISCKNLPEC